jgi:hypothetical protein
MTMRRPSVSIVTFSLASVASFGAPFGVSPGASGGTPFSVFQPPVSGSAIASQDFTNQPAYSSACLDDFTITAPVTLATMQIFGLEESGDGAALNLDVRAWILPSPSLNAVPVASLHGQQVGEDLLFNLEGLSLDAGTYWIAAQVVRPFVPSQQWLWAVSDTKNGAEAMFHNPGGGFGLGTAPIPVSTFDSGMYDMAFRLEAVPAPGVLAALALAGLAPCRRRRVTTGTVPTPRG